MQKVWYGHHERIAASKRNPGAICYGATLSWHWCSPPSRPVASDENDHQEGSMLEAARRRAARQGSGRWRRLALLTPLLAALSLPLLAGPVSAAPARGQPRQ